VSPISTARSVSFSVSARVFQTFLTEIDSVSNLSSVVISSLGANFSSKSVRTLSRLRGCEIIDYAVCNILKNKVTKLPIRDFFTTSQ